MLDTISPQASGWLSTMARLGVGFGGSVAIVGPEASDFADAYQAAGAGPIVLDLPGIAVVGTTEPLHTNRAGTAAIPDDAVGAVIARRAWQGRAEFNAALAEAERICRPGGTLVVMEPDIDRLTTSPLQRYPGRLQFDLHPELLSRAQTRLVSGNDISVELIRLGCTDVALTSIDEEIGSFLPGEYADRIDRLWGALGLLTADERRQLLHEAVDFLPRLAIDGLIRAAEPWWVGRAVAAR